MFLDSNSKVVFISYPLSVLLILLTICIYCIKWKFVSAEHIRRSRGVTVIHMCIILFISQVTLLVAKICESFGIKTSGERCTSIIALHHLTLLALFFSLLNRACAKMYIAMMKLETPRKSFVLGLQYGPPTLIIGITLAMTLPSKSIKYTSQTKCSISENGNIIIWSFLLPAGICIVLYTGSIIYVFYTVFTSFQVCFKGKNTIKRFFHSPQSPSFSGFVNDAILIFNHILVWLSVLVYYYEKQGATLVYKNMFTICHSLLGASLCFTSVFNSDEELNPFTWIAASIVRRTKKCDPRIPLRSKNQISPG